MYLLEYHQWLTGVEGGDIGGLVGHLSEMLTAECMAEYKRMTQHITNIVKVTLDTFTYLYDFYAELEATGQVPYSKDIEDRLVVAFGRSKSPTHTRERSRMRGWIGPTETFLGIGRDKGHFIAHTIGGRVDGFEINLFSQARPVNRGWSVDGKRYRRMEQYCAVNPGTFCFARPIYQDQSSTPVRMEFGILRPDGTLWVEEFEN